MTHTGHCLSLQGRLMQRKVLLYILARTNRLSRMGRIVDDKFLNSSNTIFRNKYILTLSNIKHYIYFLNFAMDVYY